MRCLCGEKYDIGLEELKAGMSEVTFRCPRCDLGAIEEQVRKGVGVNSRAVDTQLDREQLSREIERARILVRRYADISESMGRYALSMLGLALVGSMAFMIERAKEVTANDSPLEIVYISLMIVGILFFLWFFFTSFNSPNKMAKRAEDEFWKECPTLKSEWDSARREE